MQNFKVKLQPYGVLLVKEELQPSIFRCSCICGKEVIASSGRIERGETNKCLHKGPMSYRAEYRAWSAMKDRCLPDYKMSRIYYEKGIRVHHTWEQNFEEFFAHIGERPSDKHSLDRINTYKGYEPGNVRWATASQQINNRRPSNEWGK